MVVQGDFQQDRLTLGQDTKTRFSVESGEKAMPASMRLVALSAWPLVCMAISFVVAFTSKEKFVIMIVVVSRD